MIIFYGSSQEPNIKRKFDDDGAVIGCLTILAILSVLLDAFLYAKWRGLI